MSLLFIRFLAVSLENLVWRTGFLSFQPAAGVAGLIQLDQEHSHSQPQAQPHIWFAVPKSKISHSRKRIKGTLRDRLRLREDIITDPRTGETTLRHRLPWNWKEYLLPTEPNSEKE